MLKAKARVYTLGEAVGTTRYTVSDPEVLKNAIKSDKVPLLSSFENFNDPDKVIGHAELSFDGDSLYATLTFNEAYSDSKDGLVSSMEIRSIALNETCLGGKLDDIWEET